MVSNDIGHVPSACMPRQSPKAVKRILFVAHDAQLYGAQLSLLDALRNLDREKFSPLVAVPLSGPFVGEVTRLGIPVFVGGVGRWMFQRKLFKLRSIVRRPWLLARTPVLFMIFIVTFPVRVARLLLLMRRECVDIVYTNTVTVIDGAIAALLSRRPHIWHLRERIEGNKEILSLIPSERVPRVVLALSSKVAVNSCSLRQHIFSESSSTDKIAVIHNGVDIRRFGHGDAPTTLHENLGIPLGVSLVGICGFIQERKGQETFVRSAAEVHKKYPGAHFIVIGDGFRPYISHIEQLGQQLGLEGNLHLIGWRKDIPDIFRELEVLVVASEQEPFGRTVIEGMAAATPIVATRSGGPEEIVIHGETGFLVEVGNHREMAQKVLDLLESPELASKMGRAGRERAEAYFSQEQYARGIDELICAALASTMQD